MGYDLNRISGQGHLLCRNVKRFRGGLVFKALALLNSRLESNKEEEGSEQGRDVFNAT